MCYMSKIDVFIISFELTYTIETVLLKKFFLQDVHIKREKCCIIDL